MKHIKVDKRNTNFTGSVIDDDGDIAYYLNGKYHREDGPAIEFVSGYKAWYYNDEFISRDPDYTLEDFQREIKSRIFK